MQTGEFAYSRRRLLSERVTQRESQKLAWRTDREGQRGCIHAPLSARKLARRSGSMLWNEKRNTVRSNLKIHCFIRTGLYGIERKDLVEGWGDVEWV